MRSTLTPRGIRRAGLAITAAAAVAAAGFALSPAAGAAPTAPAGSSSSSASSTSSTSSASSGSSAKAAASSAHGLKTERSCAVSTQPGHMACKALKVTSGVDSLAVSARSKNPAATPSGYGPSDLQSAYNLPSSGGSGATVAIVDAYDDPNAEQDLATYRSTYGLPECSTADGCFSKVGQSGTSSLPSADAGWAEEISLDLDMVSATCPQCHILLVEADSSSMGDLGESVNTAVSLGAKYVSNSYGGGESSADSSYDSSYFDHPGVAITVSSGDSGYGPEYPAASQYVTAVGGTSLAKDSSSRGWTDSVWSGAGSGCAAYDAKPGWQTDGDCAKRTIADVSAVADPATGVAVYDTYGSDSGWEVFGGTSASSPIIASVYALAGTPSSGSYPASFPYAHTGSLNDVTSGSNGSCSGSYLCSGASGYDGPSGLGTPNGTDAFAG